MGLPNGRVGALGGNHAEVIAHRVGEPFGSLVLAVAVTADSGTLIPEDRPQEPARHPRAFLVEE
ncbi:hypothetical protein [Streptomyces sp. NPDC001478]